MDKRQKRIEILNKMLNDMLERGENQNDLHHTKVLSEILSDTLNCLYKDKDKETERNIQSFITSRITNIINDESPIKFESDAKAILHLIPLSAFEQKEQQMDIKALQQNTTQFSPFGSGSYNYRYNYDGYLTYSKNVYTQVFRNGCIEAVSGHFYNESEKKFYASRFESTVIDNTSKYIEVLNQLGIKSPFYIYITLTEIRGYLLAPYSYFFDHYEIDKKEITLPRVKIEELENITLSMKKAFDILWNAGGVSGSINYENGEWKPKF